MSHERFDRKVDGMICPQCEDEIAHKLLHTRGILSCTASYRKSTVTADFDPDILSADDIGRILAGTGYPVGDGRSGRRADAIALVLVACLYFAVPALTGLVRTPGAERGVGFGALFVIGLLTGVHCIGMCGGILLAQGNALLYNGGRLLSYTLMGAVFGALGTYISYDLQVKSMLLTVCGLLVVLIGLRMWGVPFLRRISPGLTRPCRFRGKALAVGLLTGLMPCGALSSMWIFAASSGSWVSGAASMLAFGAGTCVFMLLFGLLGAFLPKRYNKYLLKGSTILIVALGLSLMTKGIRLLA